MNPFATSSESSRARALTKNARACRIKIGFGGSCIKRVLDVVLRPVIGVVARDEGSESVPWPAAVGAGIPPEDGRVLMTADGGWAR